MSLEVDTVYPTIYSTIGDFLLNMQLLGMWQTDKQAAIWKAHNNLSPSTSKLSINSWFAWQWETPSKIWVTMGIFINNPTPTHDIV